MHAWIQTRARARTHTHKFTNASTHARTHTNTLTIKNNVRQFRFAAPSTSWSSAPHGSLPATDLPQSVHAPQEEVLQVHGPDGGDPAEPG